MKLLIAYKDLAAIIVIDMAAAVNQVEIQLPLARILLNQRLVDDAEACEIESVLNNNINMFKKKAAPLKRVLEPPPKPSVEEAPKLELKPLPSHLKMCLLVRMILYL